MSFASPLLLGCGSGQSKSPNDEYLTASGGKKVGVVTRLTDNESEFTYDPDQDGQPENRWRTKNGQIQTFDKFDPKTGRIRTRSHYLRGVLNRVEVFNADGSVRGIVNYPDGRQAESVELPRKKKLVEFVKP